MNFKSLTTSLVVVLALACATAPAWSETDDPGWERLVFHLDDVSNARWAMMLANSYLSDSPGARIVFVAYGPGIDFLLKSAEDRRGSPFAPTVAGLIERGVEFRVCAATLGARNIDRARLLDSAVVVPSGLSEIARLQLKEGYAYLKP
jgi:intracellular sulfur oxidation DsrE/DsrF family protein